MDEINHYFAYKNKVKNFFNRVTLRPSENEKTK